MEYEEQIIKKTVVRDGKKQIIKTTDKDGYKMLGGKETKMDHDEVITRSKSAKKGAKKARSKKSQTTTKRNRSMKKRPESLEIQHTVYSRIFKEDFMDSWKDFLKSFKDIKDTIKNGGSYDQLENQQGKLKGHLSDVKDEIKDIKDKIEDLQGSGKNKKTIDKLRTSMQDLEKERKELPSIDSIEKDKSYKGDSAKIFDAQEKIRDKKSDLTKDIKKYKDAISELDGEGNPEVEKEKKNLVELQKTAKSIQDAISDLRDKLVSMTPDTKD